MASIFFYTYPNYDISNIPIKIQENKDNETKIQNGFSEFVNKKKENVDFIDKKITSTNISFSAVTEEPEILIHSISSTKEFRRRLLSEKLNEVSSLLNLLKQSIGKTNGVIILVKIKRKFNEIWEILNLNDRDFGLTISLLSKFMSGNFWKTVNIDLIDSLIEALQTYSEFPGIEMYEKVKGIFHKYNINILPEIDLSDE